MISKITWNIVLLQFFNSISILDFCKSVNRIHIKIQFFKKIHFLKLCKHVSKLVIILKSINIFFKFFYEYKSIQPMQIFWTLIRFTLMFLCSYIVESNFKISSYPVIFSSCEFLLHKILLKFKCVKLFCTCVFYISIPE